VSSMKREGTHPGPVMRRGGLFCFPLAFLTGGAGPFELAIIFTAVLLLFGAKRLPEFARTLGRVMRELRRASQEFRDHLMEADDVVRSRLRDMVDDAPYSAAPDQDTPVNAERDKEVDHARPDMAG
jgi:sec-independent protein translocase protein TatA